MEIVSKEKMHNKKHFTNKTKMLSTEKYNGVVHYVIKNNECS